MAMALHILIGCLLAFVIFMRMRPTHSYVESISMLGLANMSGVWDPM